MRADDDVDVALAEPLARLLGLLRRDKARKAPDIQGEAFETGGKILVMLAGEQGCRRNHRDLLAVHRRDEGGAQRNFGLAETDIAADEAIHRLAAFEVRQDIGDGAVLIIGFLVLEPVEELVVRPFLDFEDRRFPQGAGGSDLHQLARDRLDPLLEARASLLPRFTAQSVELDRFLARSIAAEDVDILDRDEQLVSAAIFELHAVVLRFAHRNRFEAEIFADPVFGMDDQIADAERLQFGKEGVGIAALLLAAHQPVAENVLLGQQFQLVIGEARLERDDHRGRLAFGRLAQRFLPAFGGLHCDARFVENRHDARAAALRIGGDQRPPARFGDGLEMVGQHRIDIVAPRALRREIPARPEAEIEHAVAFRFVECGRAMGGHIGERGLELALSQIKRVGLQGTVTALGLSARRLALFVIVADILGPLFSGGQRGLIDHDKIVLAQMIEQRRQTVFEQGQPMLHPCQATPFADRFVKRILRGIGAEHFAIPRAEALDAVFVQQCLAGRKQQMPVEPTRRQLGVGIEAAQAFQLVAEEIEPQRFVHPAWEHIHDRSTDRVFALVDHRIGAGIALTLEQGGQAFAPDLHARREFAHAFADAERRENALQRGVGRRHQQLRAGLARLQAV